jgi:hypothetical protein
LSYSRFRHAVINLPAEALWHIPGCFGMPSRKRQDAVKNDRSDYFLGYDSSSSKQSAFGAMQEVLRCERNGVIPMAFWDSLNPASVSGGLRSDPGYTVRNSGLTNFAISPQTGVL